MSSRPERLQSRLKAREAEKKATQSSDGTRFKIVLVDDEQPNLDALVRALNRHYDVTAFKNPEDALEYIVNGRCPDLIITDQRMPEMSGVDLLCEVGKAHPYCVGFILSGFTDRADLLGRGADLVATQGALRRGAVPAHLATGNRAGLGRTDSR